MTTIQRRRVSRRRLLRLATGVAAGAPLVRAQAGPGRPNLIFLLGDDHRWDALGCMGNRIIRTPNIDAMSREGVTFTNNFVTTSICMTSRASLFTGLYARSHGINDFTTPFTGQQYARIYPVALRMAGYRTGFIGKWGVGDQMPRERFDYFAGFPGQGHYFPKRPDTSVHLTEVMGAQSIEFLRGCTPAQPFCLSVSFKAPHVQDDDPLQFLHSRKTADLYRDVEIPVPKTAAAEYIRRLPPEVQRSECRRRWAVRFATPELFQESVKSYYRLITEIDMVAGRIREELRRMKVEDDTVVVYTGDNGFYLGEHGLAGKWLMHEESIRTPLVVFDPRLPADVRGGRRAEMTLNIDVAPTLLGLAGVAAPPMQGRDLAPLIRGEKPRWRSEWFYEHLFQHNWIPRTEGLRTETRKYFRYLDAQPPAEEMYDLSADPLEERNLAREDGHRARCDEMAARCDQWIRALSEWTPNRSWREPS